MQFLSMSIWAKGRQSAIRIQDLYVLCQVPWLPNKQLNHTVLFLHSGINKWYYNLYNSMREKCIPYSNNWEHVWLLAPSCSHCNTPQYGLLKDVYKMITLVNPQWCQMMRQFYCTWAVSWSSYSNNTRHQPIYNDVKWSKWGINVTTLYTWAVPCSEYSISPFLSLHDWQNVTHEEVQTAPVHHPINNWPIDCLFCCVCVCVMINEWMYKCYHNHSTSMRH